MDENPTGRFRFHPEPTPPNPSGFDPVVHAAWLDRQFRALGEAADQADLLDVLSDPTAFEGNPQIGTMRYFEDTPLEYGPGPYCYKCRPTGLPAPDDTICYWTPMFPVDSRQVLSTGINQGVAVPALTWTQIAELSITVRIGRRIRVVAICNGGTSGRTDINLAYRFVVDGTPEATIPLFGFDHVFTNVNVDQFFQTHTTHVLTDPLLDAVTKEFTVGLEAFTDVDIGATVDDWEFFLEEV